MTFLRTTKHCTDEGHEAGHDIFINLSAVIVAQPWHENENFSYILFENDDEILRLPFSELRELLQPPDFIEVLCNRVEKILPPRPTLIRRNAIRYTEQGDHESFTAKATAIYMSEILLVTPMLHDELVELIRANGRH